MPFSRGNGFGKKKVERPKPPPKPKYYLRWTDRNGKRHTRTITGSSNAVWAYDRYKSSNQYTNVTLTKAKS